MASELPLAESALSFRGYNVTNLGRTPELAVVPAYRRIVEEELDRFSQICADVVHRSVDLGSAVRTQREYGLDRYAEAVALIVAIETAQLRLLAEVHGIDCRAARLSFGYSLGEMTAVCCGGVFAIEDLVTVPLAMAADCAEMAHDVTMGILFSREETINAAEIEGWCERVTSEGAGAIGVSAVLSPNSLLVLGQGDSVQRLKGLVDAASKTRLHLRINEHRWPPLHTPIVRQRHVPDRSAVLLERLPGGWQAAQPPVFSLAAGRRAYDGRGARGTLREWVDRPQRLWDAVCDVLASGVRTVIHVGPEPNVVPATFHRLAENIRQQANGRSWSSFGLRAVAGLVERPWLASLLPTRAALLRAPEVKQINLEDWLLEFAPRE
ncbi:MAG: ACP S-malonyltransferase [Pirellulales bacterium]|nr:ACP S-malonyltransferase [Pirellulales bacterium]